MNRWLRGTSAQIISFDRASGEVLDSQADQRPLPATMIEALVATLPQPCLVLDSPGDVRTFSSAVANSFGRSDSRWLAEDSCSTPRSMAKTGSASQLELVSKLK